MQSLEQRSPVLVQAPTDLRVPGHQGDVGVRRQDLLDPVQKKIEAAVKSVAEAKGLSVVLVKDSVVYGGQDITQDVVKKLSK